MRKNKTPQIGEIFWLKTESEVSHPHVIIEINGDTATVCAITTNKKKINLPGNVSLAPLEGNLEKESIVDVAKVIKIEINLLTDYIGNLGSNRIEEIKRGINFLGNTYLKKHIP